MSHYFVTGTGTAVGKTWIVENLISRFQHEGLEVRALKPVISGFDSAKLAQSDVGRLLVALGKELTPAEIDTISPWRFAAPLSPDMAASQENQKIPFDAVVAYCQKQINAAKRASSTLLIEGIGGVMVPLDERHTVLDLIAAADIPAIVVCGSYLGSLSHTLTACSALRHRNVVLDRIIVNETPDSSVSLTDTRETLMRFLPNVTIDIQTYVSPPLSAS